MSFTYCNDISLFQPGGPLSGAFCGMVRHPMENLTEWNMFISNGSENIPQ
jgi:hypothetical protein